MLRYGLRLEVVFIYEIVIYVDSFTFLQCLTYAQVSVRWESMTDIHRSRGVLALVTGLAPCHKPCSYEGT
jgi:hypothetical protein